MFTPASTLTILLLLLTQQTTASRQCYNHQGAKLDAAYTPCNTNSTHSGCCAAYKPNGEPLDVCLDSGLCMGASGTKLGVLAQVGCTDPTWRDPACPQLCPNGTSRVLEFTGVLLATGGKEWMEIATVE